MTGQTRLDELICSYLAGDISSGDMDQLTGLLRQDRQARSRLAELAQQDLAIRHVLHLEAAGRSSADTQWHGSASAAARLSRGWIIALAAAAAALVICVYGMNWHLAQRAEAAVVGRVLEARGSILCTTPGGEHSGLTAGGKINIGDRIETGSDGYLKFAYNDWSEVELRGNTRMTLAAGSGSRMLGLMKERRGKRIELDAGRLSAQVVKQKTGRNMTVTTSHASTMVVGTRFSLMVSGNGRNASEKGVSAPSFTRVEVKEGIIRFSRTQEGQFIEVPEGCFAVAGDGIEFKAQLIEKERFYRRWTFEKGPSGDLKPVAGAWHWARGADGSGRMVPDGKKQEVLFLLPSGIPRHPLVLTVKGRSPDADFSLNPFWVDGEGVLPHGIWMSERDKKESSGGGDSASTFYLIGQRIFWLRDGVELGGLMQLESDSPSRTLAFHLMRMSVAEIELEELDAEMAEELTRTLNNGLTVIEQQVGRLIPMRGMKFHLLSEARKEAGE
ncbi:MAG: hypothetical protein C0404_13175 [Verrucomicrobia bacterium]|nr:hypothetical protein [Verrucomicrobiota bacterium]